MSRRIVLLAASTVMAGSVIVAGPGTEPVGAALAATAQGTVCVGDRLTDLDRLFDTEPARIIGADYQRATELPDGRVFWTFQDGAIRTDPTHVEIVHNIAAIQDGPCFTFLYRGTPTTPRSFLFADATVPYRRWFWPLGAELGADGLLHVFAAEMREDSDGYLDKTVPVATRVTIIDPDTLAIVWEGSPSNSSADLYGWSITSDADWTYLYAQCFRQFGFDAIVGVLSHDLDCAARITVGRVPKGQLLAAPEYWDGGRWQADPARAVAIITTAGRLVNANQIVWTGGRFMSINKEGDWWGDTIYVSTSSSPTGPFVLTTQVVPPVRCADCNTFFASWVPWAAGERLPRTLGYGLSNNRWDGVPSAAYRPTFATVEAPIFLPAGGVFRVPTPSNGVTVLNVTAVRPDDAGFVTVFPCDRPVPTASNLNFGERETTANLALVRPDSRGEVCIFSYAATDLVIDSSGSLGGAFVPEPVPRRLIDTRDGEPVAAGEVVEIAVPDAAGVAINLTAVRPRALGFLTAFPCGVEVPTASNVNFRAGANTANLAVVRPGHDGSVCVVSDVATDLVVDLAGVFGPSLVPEPVPVRLVDTRATKRVASGTVLEIELPEPAAAEATGAVVNVTAVRPGSDGFLTVFPCGSPVPTASNVNYRAGENRAGLAIVRPSDDGRVCVFSWAETDLVVDLTGFVGDGFVPDAVPVRLADTRLLP